MADFAEMGFYRQQYQQAMFKYNRAKRDVEALESKLTAGGVEDVQALLDQIEDARAACDTAKSEYEAAWYLYNTGRPKPGQQETETKWFTPFGVPARPPKR